MGDRISGGHCPKCLEMQIYCTYCLEFARQWSAQAATNATLKGVSLRIAERASAHFIAGKDELALEVREIMREVDKRQGEEAERLEKHFINYKHPNLTGGVEND